MGSPYYTLRIEYGWITLEKAGKTSQMQTSRHHNWHKSQGEEGIVEACTTCLAIRTREISVLAEWWTRENMASLTLAQSWQEM